MEQWLNICAGVTKTYVNEIMLAVAAILVILMIILLKTVRKHTKAIYRMEAREKELLMLFAEQMRGERKREQILEQHAKSAEDAAAKRREEEELFGSVIQEIFP